MRRAIWIIAFLALFLALTDRVQAACTFDQIKHFLDRGINQEQVTMLCSLIPGDQTGESSSQTPNASDQSLAASGPFTLGLVQPEIGNDGTWNKYVARDSYVLQNKLDPAAYFLLLSTKSMDRGWRSLSIEARFHHEKNAGIVGAALVFTTDPKTEELSVFLFLQDGTVSAYLWKGDQLTLMATKQSPDFSLHDYRFQTYDLVESSDQIELVVNSKNTGLKIPYEDTKPVVFGLAVFGLGSYEFRNFVIKDK